MGVLAARIMYVGMLLFSFGFAAVVVTAIAFSGEAWSQPFSIVGNIVGYSTPVVLLITLIRLCHGKYISCRVEFALASIASILWFIAASLAWSDYSLDTNYRRLHIPPPSILPTPTY